jgi:hypothetical protein
MNRIRWPGLFLLLLSALAFSRLALAQGEFSLNWWSVAGGGSRNSGGSYALSGSSGQKDAGGSMSGGAFDLQGGFWALPVAAPTAPTGLAATAVLPSQINLIWQDNSSDETNFRVERSPNGSSGWLEIAVLAANSVSYSDTGLACSTIYFYRVRAFREADGQYSSYSNSSSATTHSCSLPAPTNVQASNGTFTDKVRVTWSIVSGATSYQVYRATSAVGMKTNLGDTTTTVFDDTTPAVGITYYYWLEACNSSGCSNFSSYDTGWRGVTPAHRIYLPLVRG